MYRTMNLYRFISAFALLIAAGVAPAQQYPSKPITFVFGFPPGTNLDAVARPVANEMSKRLGQPVVFEFKPGASGTIAAKQVATAKPDGYTLFYSNVMTSHPVFVRTNSVDPLKELAAVSQFVKAPYFFYVKTGLPVNSMQEFIAHAKANPGRLRYGSASSVVDLGVQLLDSQAGTKTEPVPYKGTPPTITAMLAGEVDFTIAPLQGYTSHVQAGKIRALFVASPKRYAGLPKVPSNAEVGLGKFELAANNGLWAPAGTPRNIINKLSAEAATALKMPAVAEKIRTTMDMEPMGTTPEEYTRAMEAEIKAWAEAARIAKFQPQQ